MTQSRKHQISNDRTIGSICAGIAGLDLGFEAAGWETLWQIELSDVNRAVLADRFPRTRQYRDLREWRSYSLPKVACILAGFPCQDISTMGSRKKDRSQVGLNGSRSGLFFEIMEIVRDLKPRWLVFENVPALLHSNDCADIQAIVTELAECGYVGFWRVLDAQYFGVPQKRRRIFLVAGLGRYPHMDFLADATPVESIPSTAGTQWIARPADAWAGHTLTAANTACRISLGCELLVAEEGGWNSMVERSRKAEIHGVPLGLDDANLAAAYAAGNAVVPAIARWIAEILNRS